MEQAGNIAADRAAVPRRTLLVAGGSTLAAGLMQPADGAAEDGFVLRVNGVSYALAPDPRATLLDTLRETIGLVGTKKGCDHGQCGACTVHLEGKGVLSCLTLTLSIRGEVTTIEGVGEGDALHPMQQAFIDHDAFQCGYCTPGQIMSAVACAREGHARDAAEIREYMSGNLCRCAAYPNIVAAVADGARRMGRS